MSPSWSTPPPSPGLTRAQASSSPKLPIFNDGDSIRSTSGQLSSTLPLNRKQTHNDDDEEINHAGFLTRSLDAMAQRLDAIVYSTKTSFLRGIRWLDSPIGRNVLKCTIAYTLASLATFYPPLSDLLGNLAGKHVVATITVYFHPARSAGSMIEAALIAIVAIAFAETVSILSMVSSVFVGSTLGMVTLSHVLIVVVFIGGAFGFMGWVKQKMGNPLVNVGVTLASLAIIAVVTKESAVLNGFFSNEKLIQVSKILAMGVSCTTAVNLLIWRVSAHSLLIESMAKASTSLGHMLSTITEGYLDGLRDGAASGQFASSMSAYTATYPLMMKYLRETKFEQYFLGLQDVYVLQRSAVKAIETLAQSVGGLRSAAETQLYILVETDAPIVPELNRFSCASSLVESDTLSIEDNTEHEREYIGSPLRFSRPQSPMGNPIPTPTALFDLFIASLRPAMDSLTKTLSQILCDPPFSSNPDEMTVSDDFRAQLEDALSIYNRARSLALRQLFSIIEQNKANTSRTQAGLEEVAAACGHFSFSLQSFGEEMKRYLDVLDDLKYVSEQRRRSWRWLIWWRKYDSHGRNLAALPFQTSPEIEPLIKPIRKRAYPKGIPESMIAKRDTYNWQAAPNASKELAMISQTILRVARRVTRDDIMFGLKVGIGASLMAMFAFIGETRDIYKAYRGEWGLLSFMIVCSMTVGASNTNGWLRFMGTLTGACFSVINWTLSQGNPVALVFLGWLVSLISFYIFHVQKKESLGRTAMLAYNVSTLYAYSLMQGIGDGDSGNEGDDVLSIFTIVKHRVTAVGAGIIWGLVVCRLIWPISARRKFKEGVSMLYLQMGLVWRRGPLAMLLRSDCSDSFLKSGEQAAMQRYANRLESLRQAAASEFELRGPFPFEVYGRILRSTNRVLDGFYAMSLISQRKGMLTKGERALLEYTSAERAALCDRICHVFQVLASSIMLEYPLTDAVPGVANTWDRLVSKIFEFHKESRTWVRRQSQPQTDNYGSINDAAYPFPSSPNPDEVADEQDYALLYAYALVAGQIADELKVAEREIEHLFGLWNEDSPLIQ
ncbi:putative C26F1.08c-like protein [Cladobotryum mycophilum]|uniref:C26F1.08c-like protein n=1 Tax=Cladobotryum mycophilum TaxID=491253 RepID=A0ABR0SIG1_9HYPO